MYAILASFRRDTKPHIERCIECYVERCFKHCLYVVHFILLGVSGVASSTAFDAISGAVSGAASGVVSGAFTAVSAPFRCCFRASCQQVIICDTASVPFAELQSSSNAVSGAVCGANSSDVLHAVSYAMAAVLRALFLALFWMLSRRFFERFLFIVLVLPCAIWSLFRARFHLSIVSGSVSCVV